MVVYGSRFSGGTLTLPPSKSAAHRALISAALSGGRSVVFPVDHSKDMEATLTAVRALGRHAIFDRDNQCAFFQSGADSASTGEIDCLESGSTLRFLIPIAAAFGGTWRFCGSGRLPQRPLGVYEKLLPEHGVTFQTLSPPDSLPLQISGKLTPGLFEVPGNISSQFITGLLFALPLLDADSEIKLTTPLESSGYVDLTISVLHKFGIEIQQTEGGWKIPGGQQYQSRSYMVERDWSQAAFFLSMAALAPNGEAITLCGLDPESKQGDRTCVSIFEGFGLKSEWNNRELKVWNPNAQKPFGGLRGQVIDVSQVPDMVPALAVCAALSEGETRIIGASRLRLKESDRLAAMEHAINRLGGHCASDEDSLTIQGVPALTGGRVEGENDHRIVMALAAAALRSQGEIEVTDEQSIQKSYPGFFADFQQLGGDARVVDLGRTD